MKNVPFVSEKKDKVKSADRALEVMEILVHAPPGLTHSQLANSLGIPKSSLTKILSSLMVGGYVQRPDGFTYQVGERWRALVKASIAGNTLDSLARATVERIVQATGETAGFNMIVDAMIETITTIPGNQQLQYTMIQGEREPPHRMSSGQAIIAYMEPEFHDRYFDQVVCKDSSSPIRTKAAYHKAMQEICKRGYAELRGHRAGIVGFGVPVLTKEGMPLASLNVAIPQVRLNEDVKANAIAALKAGSSNLAKLLEGWVDPICDWLETG
ncbi:IclR family transcriptional regulator [Novosphingobium sp.]|uniref:IclR family transcriptional regulator n=1 Tax=Novosphingobium sp. TaxID=1874826 RepID=UPI002B46390F|nr:helix-turn-helix domain-containing protein [Novosphingobium sp.]HKR91768.1 helix-turn-helix domain-containing protein [Novosphingobium sp.]